jgi:hypothetical protein
VSADLALELHRRNARLRAWRAYGVPLGASGWRRWGNRWLLVVGCDTCDTQFGNHVLGLGLNEFKTPKALEREVLLRSCPHLAPLLGDDPPEVTAIAELELLAG